jgi:outer membrane protein TolC
LHPCDRRRFAEKAIARAASRGLGETPASECDTGAFLSRIRTLPAVADYEKTIQTIFREVSDGLGGCATLTAQPTAQTDAVQQAERRLALACPSNHAGVTGRLELLDTQRSVYAARQTLLAVRHAELTGATALHRALGGEME